LREDFRKLSKRPERINLLSKTKVVSAALKDLDKSLIEFCLSIKISRK
jgi:hypothetical protein